MRLIKGARARAATHARLANGIKKKAKELATLCGVSVAIVCAPSAAGEVPLEWESEGGVLDRYRALPQEIRAQHTLRNHLEAELAKERARLARVQQRHAMPPLGDMTPAEARKLLESIDTAVSATRKRLEALGLTAGGRLEQIAADAVTPQLGHDGLPRVGSNGGDTDVGLQLQMAPPCAGRNDDVGPRREDQFSCDDGFQMHNAGMAQPGFVLPVGYYYYPSLGMGFGGHFMDGTAAPDQSAIAQLGYAMAMAMGGNFISRESYTGYWRSAQDFQRADANTSTSTSHAAASPPQSSNPGTSISSNVLFRYL